MNDVLEAPKASAVILGKISGIIKEIFPEKCQKILLVNIPGVSKEDFDLATAKLKRYPCFPPYGIGILSRKLQEAGYEAKIIDLNFEILSRVSEDNFNYDLWKEKLKEAVGSFCPDIIGISSMFSANHLSLKAVANYIGRTFPNIPIVAGGVHPSGNTRQVLEDILNIDIVILYEADRAFVNLIDFANGKAEENALSQIALLWDGEYLCLENRNAPDRDEVGSPPDYDGLPIGEYSDFGEIGVYRWLKDYPKGTSIIAHRGCRGNCTYCAVRSFNGVGVRSRKTSAVADEMEFMAEKHGIRHFMWLDDDLFRPDAIELFGEIARRNLGITWDASNAVIASATTEEIVESAQKSGCIGLSFGIESGDPDILKMVRKPSGIKHFQKTGAIMKKYPRIFTKGFLMIGFQGETIGQIWNTINLAKEIGLDWYPIQTAVPLGGTDMAKRMLEGGLLGQREILMSKLYIGPAGGQKRKESDETKSSSFNLSILNPDNKNKIPLREELSDIWFVMDYLLNYDRLKGETRMVKLQMHRLHLRHILNRSPKRIAMASLYLGIVNKKLGNHKEARENFKDTERYLEESAFWKVRFEALGLNPILQDSLKSC